MTPTDVLLMLDEVIAHATPEAKPGLALALTARLGTLAAGMVAVPGNTTTSNGAPEAEDGWLTPEQAAGIALVPKERIYQWARGARWASRPSRRCLRIADQGFRRWLASRAG